jgi:hypothetical protein
MPTYNKGQKTKEKNRRSRSAPKENDQFGVKSNR